VTPIIAGDGSTQRPRHPFELSLPEILRNGDAGRFGFAIESITLEEGRPLILPSPGVTAIVGGNNVGKSTLLHQIKEAIENRGTAVPGPPTVLRGLTLGQSGELRDLAAWLMENAVLSQPDPNIAGSAFNFSKAGAQSVPPQYLESYWAYNLGPLASHLVYAADARSRHEWTRPTTPRPSIDQPPAHPMHVFQEDSALTEELSEICREAFGEKLTIDPLSGQLFFRVGGLDIEAPRVDKITPEYVDRLRQLRPLAQQGDGMVFMLGALIPIIAATFPVILLDEPEAFLHPPQAFLMGQALARLSAERELQILVATHDRNVLRGLLDVPSAAVAIARVSRTQDQTQARLLSVDHVRTISTHAVLRYTNILDGLFHQLVVLAENERDCRFYQAALEHANQTTPLPIPPHDVLFVPTGGFGSMPATARVLKDTGVKVVASPDLDILSSEGALRSLVEALGGEWDSELRNLYSRATQQFRQPPTRRRNSEVLAIIRGALEADPDGIYDRQQASLISEALAVPSRWAALKHDGKYAMRNDREARDALFQRLDQIGVVLVAVGELENFDRDAPKDKNRWLPEALESGAHRSTDAIEHIDRLLPSNSQPPVLEPAGPPRQALS